MNALFASFANAQLQWLPELGIGYFPVTQQPYDAAYWERYRAMDATPMGRALTAARVELVEDFTKGPLLVDVGIGGGAFIEAWPYAANGHDVNPEALAWLRDDVPGIDRRWDGEHPVDAMTFWDSLEHIHDPAPLLAKCREWAFVSMPIYRDAEHILRSKHFRKDEHCWYFTDAGLRTFMRHFGFECVHSDDRESRLGREDIGTYVFRRVGA